jgi:hypothetical protein
VRWHLMRSGRIVRTAWASDPDVAERELTPYPTELLVSDEDWRTTHYRRALLTLAAEAGRQRTQERANPKVDLSAKFNPMRRNRG